MEQATTPCVARHTIHDSISERYDAQTEATYAASRMWVDEIIDPAKTRPFISTCLEAANYGIIEPFNVGVLQT